MLFEKGKMCSFRHEDYDNEIREGMWLGSVRVSPHAGVNRDAALVCNLKDGQLLTVFFQNVKLIIPESV